MLYREAHCSNFAPAVRMDTMSSPDLEAPLGDDLLYFMRWAQSVYARFGFATLLAAGALFAAARFANSLPLRVLALSVGGVLVLLMAADLARSLLERDKETTPPRYLPLTPFQFVLTGIQAGIYTFMIFVVLAPLTPYVFILPVFGLACIAAWRNVRLWYRQGAEYEDDLKEAGEIEKRHLERVHWRDNER